jgi:predicted lipid-binding transport protein (Tim44 family)
MEVTRMGGSATGPASAQDSAQAAPASQPAADAPPTTASGMLGAALGGSVLGGFHRMKAAQPAATPASTTTTNADGTQTTSAILMEMTMQKSNFSQETVAASYFQVPPGFKKVESPAYGSAGK